jgi:type I restriction enzyme M protein
MAKKAKQNGNGANLGFEETLWATADKLRGHMDAAEYKHVVLGLIFLKYISDAFQERYEVLKKDKYADPEDRDEYAAENVFWVPKDARWEYLQGKAKQPVIGKLIDEAMLAIEKENPSLRGVLATDYARPTLDKQRLGELIDLIGTIGLGDADSRSKDILGRVYEYFLGKFASAEGKGGGEFYTPQSVVRLLVEMIEPYKGRIYDPCCGSGGMFVQSEKFVLAHGGRLGDLSIYGQESNPTTWRLCKMNLAIRGIDGNIGTHNADSFANDLHKDLKADFILANPPFNISDWGGDRLRQDVRWKYGAPPVSNANFAWVQHILHHLSPGGLAGFVLSNGALSTNQTSEAAIRAALVENDFVDCVVYLPPQLFYTTQISVSLWFLARNKAAKGRIDRRGQTLFIYAHDLGYLVDRTHRDLTNDELTRIASAYRTWRTSSKYKDVPGFCRSAHKREILEHNMCLVPGRYVGFAQNDADVMSLQDIHAEIQEIRNRITTTCNASESALAIIQDLLYGTPASA